MWHIRFGGERWLYLVLLLEFQSGVDRAMAVRMLTCSGLEQGRAQGLEQGRIEERALLCRLAARKFDAAAGRDAAPGRRPVDFVR